jgi:hypothetical protein
MEDAKTTAQSADLRRGTREYVWFAIALLFILSLVVLKSRI